MIPLFTDKIFHNVGIGLDAAKPDIGVAAVNEKDETKTGAFKTPTLRAAARSAPYFHDGSVATLEEAVKFMGNGGKDNPHRDVLLKEPRSVERRRHPETCRIDPIAGQLGAVHATGRAAIAGIPPTSVRPLCRRTA